MKVPKQELKNGVELCFKNVNSLIESATILVEHGDYGHSRFLSLSAIEETIKAFMYAWKNIEVGGNDEISREIFRHKSKFSGFVFLLWEDVVRKSREKGNIMIDKPLGLEDITDKTIDSVADDLRTDREDSLYIDYKQGKWVSPSDIEREEAEAWIEIAQGKKREIEPLCKAFATVPSGTEKEVNEFMDKLRPSLRDQFYRDTAEVLYKNNRITKKLYEKMLNSITDQNITSKS